MGWNTGYTIMEATVVGAYDLGRLDKPLLKVLLEPYRDSDIDSGGKEGLTSKDGLEVEEIILKVMGVKLPPEPKLPKDFTKWTDEQRQQNDDYQEALCDAFNGVTEKFGW